MYCTYFYGIRAYSIKLDNLIFLDNKSTTVEWNEVSGISEPQKMNYCVKIYENFYNVHVGKRRDFSSKADDVMLHSVYFRIPRTSPKDIRVLACRFRFDTVHNGTNDVLFIRPSKTWSRVYIFKKLRRNVFYLHTDIAVDRIDVFR